MMTAAEFRGIALSFDGVSEQPHFDRVAFKAKRIFASIAPDQKSANLLLTAEDQQLRCAIHAGALSPVANKWGQRGWTTLDLGSADLELANSTLHAAWLNGVKK
jgi:hypothetical protein